MSRLRPISVIKQTNVVNNASVIFLHGSGDTGRSFVEWINSLIEDFSLPHIKFLFPTAPLRPYIPSDGKLNYVWFNRYEISPDAPDHVETLDDIKPDIMSLVSQEMDRGISLDKIIIGGFSMGGSLALHAGYHFIPGVAGVFTLSSFLNSESIVYNDIKATETPLFMCHGDHDEHIPLEWGQTTFNTLTSLGVVGEFITIDDCEHELKEDELRMLLKWITNIIPP